MEFCKKKKMWKRKKTFTHWKIFFFPPHGILLAKLQMKKKMSMTTNTWSNKLQIISLSSRSNTSSHLFNSQGFIHLRQQFSSDKGGWNSVTGPWNCLYHSLLLWRSWSLQGEDSIFTTVITIYFKFFLNLSPGCKLKRKVAYYNFNRAFQEL